VLASDVPAPLAADLPSAGLLSFFYLDDGTAWGFDPKDRGKFAVRHFPDASALKKSAEWPEGVEPRFTEVPIRFEPTVTIPSFETLFREESSPPKEETRAYQDLEEALVAKEGIADQTRVLGHPHQVQGEMSTECALVREGIYCGDGKYPEHPRYEEISRKAGEWRLLLQVHSFEEAGMCWGDLGTLYFWIPDASLKARRFEDAWMVLQCS
jgi:uncharacterized protein YwqG